MKTCLHHSKATFTLLLLLTLLPASLRAQFFPRPPWGSAAIETIGGVTYFTFGGRLPSCQWIETGPMLSGGQGFLLPVWKMTGEICVDCLDCYNLQTNSVVLGKLPPGDYVMQAKYAMLPGLPQPGDPMVYQQAFTVPAAVEPTLTVIRTGSTLQVTVVTAPAAEVVIYTSTDLLRWTPLPGGIPVNGPYSFTVATTNKHQFFRASLSSGSVLEAVF